MSLKRHKISRNVTKCHTASHYQNVCIKKNIFFYQIEQQRAQVWPGLTTGPGWSPNEDRILRLQSKQIRPAQRQTRHRRRQRGQPCPRQAQLLLLSHHHLTFCSRVVHKWRHNFTCLVVIYWDLRTVDIELHKSVFFSLKDVTSFMNAP